MQVDVQALDRSADACEDFYQFACGGWIASTAIPADRPSWHRSFSEIQQRNQRELRHIVEEIEAGRLDTPYGDELAAFWTSCMDEGAKGSLPTLERELTAIDAIGDKAALGPAIARLQRQGTNAFFSFRSVPDFKNATEVIGGADQGGLGLPDREQYLRDDERSQSLRRSYEEHIANMLALAGTPKAQAQKDAAAILAIETELARHSMPRVDRRDPYNIYHRIDRQGLVAKAPTFPWPAYFDALGVSDVEAINVYAPGFFEGFGQVFDARPLEELRAYLRWQLLTAAAPALPPPFVEEDFRLQRLLTGQEELPPRWRICLEATDRALGFALARPFVERTFGKEGKAISQELIREIEEAFRANLATLDWMDDETKARAEGKLETLVNQIGYPEKWRSYDGLEVSKDDYLGNRLAAARFDKARDLAKIGAPVDKTDWFMTPPTVNAYYYALQNEMVFPAGILQPPFFAAGAPEAANAGAIGMVMGHELTHGYDDKGRLFDAEGNLHDWWTEESAAAFREKAQCVVEQYEGYTVGDQHLNGRLTLGENIADIGGLQMAWNAFDTRRAGRPDRPIEGFTEPQQFFLAYAQSWCSNVREELARMRVLTDPHSPPKYRVNGAVSNVPAFQQAFGCEAGQPMAPADRCVVW
jgi:predicted metalloendopeptidase